MTTICINGFDIKYHEGDYFDCDNLDINLLLYKHHNKKLEDLDKYLILTEEQEYNYDDKCNLFGESKPSKYILDYGKIDKNILNFKSINECKIPKTLLYKSEQIKQMILKEIENFNSDYSYKHYIKTENLYELDCILFLDNKFDEIKMKIDLDLTLYPFVPVRLSLEHKNIDERINYILKNLEFLRQSNWNPTLRLKDLILELVKKFNENLELYYLDKEINKLEKIIFELGTLTNLLSEKSDKFEIDTTKLQKSSDKKYWAGGTGFGFQGASDWDIDKYIDSQKILKNNIILCLNKVYLLLDKFYKDIDLDILVKYLDQQLTDINFLELFENNRLYNLIFKIVIKLNKLGIEYYKDSFCELNEEFNNESLELNDDQNKSKELIKNLVEFKKVSIEEIKLDLDDYKTKMKKYQVSKYTTPSYHRFYTEKDKKYTPKVLSRIAMEISSLKKSLPLDYGSMALLQIDKKCIHLLRFFITGPKDTPYEDGIYEFHLCFPCDYPLSPPKVLLHTTGGGKFRFNPNLYANGKVCLSLLNTWSGEKGEKWNPATSTLLQVIVSIQSLIMVDMPYFNEPTYERLLGTRKGEIQNIQYNHPVLVNNLRLAMTDMIKNKEKLEGLEEFVSEYFKIKKLDINNKYKKYLEVLKESDILSVVSKKRFKEDIDNELLNLNKLL